MSPPQKSIARREGSEPSQNSLNYRLGLIVVYLSHKSGKSAWQNGYALSRTEEVAMASFDADGSWKPRRFWIGRGLYWLATVIGALMVVFIIGDFAISWAQGQPILRVFALLIALLVWLIGRACRPWGSPALTN